MKKMQDVLNRIKLLEGKESDLVALLTVDNPNSVRIVIDSNRTTREYTFPPAAITEILTFIEARLAELRSELIPLKERIQLLSELLNK